MSQLTAHSILPLFNALPEEEQREFLRIARKKSRPAPEVGDNKKKDIYDSIGDIYRPENREQLISYLLG